MIGSALIRRLVSSGYKNIVTRTHGELDLTDAQKTKRFFSKERPEYVFMAAGLSGGILVNKTRPGDFLHINTAMQDNIFEAAQECKVKKLVFYGSSCMYPRDCPQPIKEEYLMTGKLEETSQAYAIAKLSGTIACWAYNSQSNSKRFICLVPNSVFGPGDNFDPENSHVLSSLIRVFHEAKTCGKKEVTLLGSGRPKREFIFSDDVADASIFAVKNSKRLKNCHYNVGSGNEYSINELAKVVSKIIGFKGIIRWDASKPDGAPRKLLDGSRFFSLGWRPITPFEEGLRITYNWYLKYCGSRNSQRDG